MTDDTLLTKINAAIEASEKQGVAPSALVVEVKAHLQAEAEAKTTWVGPESLNVLKDKDLVAAVQRLTGCSAIVAQTHISIVARGIDLLPEVRMA